MITLLYCSHYAACGNNEKNSCSISIIRGYNAAMNCKAGSLSNSLLHLLGKQV
jgi:hypothetical protein